MFLIRCPALRTVLPWPRRDAARGIQTAFCRAAFTDLLQAGKCDTLDVADESNSAADL